MSVPVKQIQDELPSLIKLVTKSNLASRENCRRFNDFRKFVYETSITDREKEVNETLERPNIEVNVLTAYLSRMCGEFSKQEPSFEVSSEEGSEIHPDVIEIVAGHLRHISDEAKKSNTQYHTYRDELSGGFGSLEVVTEYANKMSFKQVIKIKKSPYPTLCGYDPLATEPHMGDGNYSFQIYPKSKDDFKMENPEIDIDSIVFSPADDLGGFKWAFNNGQDDIILLCKLYKKKKERVKIMELADGQTLTEKQYNKFVKDWNSSGKNEQIPAICGDPRITTLETICRYIFIEEKVIEYIETDFNNLPQVFVDGDSIDLYDNASGTIKKLTRPYAYNSKGAQQLKNLGAQCLAGYLENMSKHKYVVKKEAIPQEKDYMAALTNLQKANTIVVNAFKDNNPDHPINEPIIPIQVQAAPPEIMNSIEIADKIIQNELGSYDAALGINDNQLSGVAIVEGATQSNAAAMPYVVNYVAAWNQIAIICVDLMPKYFKTPMTIPIIDEEGNRRAVKINQKGGIDFNYDSNMLQVKVTAGVNWSIQKSRALNQIIAMTHASPAFADFMSKKGLKVLLDNFEIRGIDILKKLADEYEQEQSKAAQQQQEMQAHMIQNNPKLMSEHTKAFSAQAHAALEEEKISVEREKVDNQKQISEAQLAATLARTHAEESRAQADEIRSNIRIKMDEKEMHHRHGKESIELAHKIHGKKEVKKNEES